MSPRAVKSARSPLGDSSKSSIWPAAETRAGRFHSPSSGTVIAMAALLPALDVQHLQLAVQLVDDAARCPSALGQRTSQVRLVVTAESFALTRHRTA